MNIIPTVPAVIASITGAFDATGQKQLGISRPIMIAVVKLITGTDVTEKNAGASEAGTGTTATRENVADAVLLIPPQHQVAVGDKITTLGVNLRVWSVSRRLSVAGVIDHFEVAARPWA